MVVWMAVAACGIACEVCGALAKGKCPIGGCSKGSEASEKLERQKAVLGFNCPILECASKRGVDYCSRDCKDFPCKIYYEAGFPYSGKFLDIMGKMVRGG
ncbi:MAG: hypothetical protein DRO52_00675 [Candidatus Hecatellales archaeon]|nr:MAG: hypothetical protein DRO52_00675 [Candidatus Hecatellales archaeon]